MKIKFILNNKEVEAEKGENLIIAAEKNNVHIPRFCYHPDLEVVAMCRLCLVKVEGARKLMPACTISVEEGININTENEEVANARKSALEFVLLNHTLDCPMCDKGGECNLQNYSFDYGAVESRLKDEKYIPERPDNGVFIKQVPSRCVMCGRCVRFYRDVAGGVDWGFFNRGHKMLVGTNKDNHQPVDILSGNIIQVCPVGALLDNTFLHKARIWEMKKIETSCNRCAIGCYLNAQSRGNALLRVFSEEKCNFNINYICDKARFNKLSFYDENIRLKNNFIKKQDTLNKISNEDASKKFINTIKENNEFALILDNKLLFEEAFLLLKILTDAKKDIITATNTENYTVNFSNIENIKKSDLILIIGTDPNNSLPVLKAKIRHSIIKNNAKVYSVYPHSLNFGLGTKETKNIKCFSEELISFFKIIGFYLLEFNPATFNMDGYENWQEFKNLLEHTTYNPFDNDKIKDLARAILEAKNISIIGGNDNRQEITNKYIYNWIKNFGIFIKKAYNKNINIFIENDEGNYSSNFLCEYFNLKTYSLNKFFTKAIEEKRILLNTSNNLFKHFLNDSLVKDAISTSKKSILFTDIKTNEQEDYNLVLHTNSIFEKQGNLINLEGRAKKVNKSFSNLFDSINLSEFFEKAYIEIFSKKPALIEPDKIISSLRTNYVFKPMVYPAKEEKIKLHLKGHIYLSSDYINKDKYFQKFIDNLPVMIINKNEALKRNLKENDFIILNDNLKVIYKIKINNSLEENEYIIDYYLKYREEIKNTILNNKIIIKKINKTQDL